MEIINNKKNPKMKLNMTKDGNNEIYKDKQKIKYERDHLRSKRNK